MCNGGRLYYKKAKEATAGNAKELKVKLLSWITDLATRYNKCFYFAIPISSFITNATRHHLYISVSLFFTDQPDDQ
jgi:hypothetical protein